MLMGNYGKRSYDAPAQEPKHEEYGTDTKDTEACNKLQQRNKASLHRLVFSNNNHCEDPLSLSLAQDIQEMAGQLQHWNTHVST